MGCDIKQKNNARVSALECVIDGKNIIHIANLGNYQMMRKLLDEAPRKINNRDADGWSALHWCCANGWRDCAQLLLERGIKTTFLDKQGRSVYHLAARFGHSDLLKMLIDSDPPKASIEINRQTARSLWTPLHFACFHNHIDTAAVLIEHGANAKLENSDHRVAMHYLYDENHKVCTSKLYNNVHLSIKENNLTWGNTKYLLRQRGSCFILQIHTYFSVRCNYFQIFLRDLIEVVNKSRSKLAQLQGLRLSDIDKPVPGSQPRGAREQIAYLHSLAQSRRPPAYLQEEFTKGLREDLARQRKAKESQLKDALEVLHEGAAVHVAVASTAIKASRGHVGDGRANEHNVRRAVSALAAGAVADQNVDIVDERKEFEHTQRRAYFDGVIPDIRREGQDVFQGEIEGAGEDRVDHDERRTRHDSRRQQQRQQQQQQQLNIGNAHRKGNGRNGNSAVYHHNELVDDIPEDAPAGAPEEVPEEVAVASELPADEIEDLLRDMELHDKTAERFKGMRTTLERDEFPNEPLCIDRVTQGATVAHGSSGVHTSNTAADNSSADIWHERIDPNGSGQTRSEDVRTGRDHATGTAPRPQSSNGNRDNKGDQSVVRTLFASELDDTIDLGAPHPAPIAPLEKQAEERSGALQDGELPNLATVVGDGLHDEEALQSTFNHLTAAANGTDAVVDTIGTADDVTNGELHSRAPDTPSKDQKSLDVSQTETPTTKQLMDYRKRQQWMYEQQQRVDEQHKAEMERLLRECEEDQQQRLVSNAQTQQQDGEQSKNKRKRQLKIKKKAVNEGAIDGDRVVLQVDDQRAADREHVDGDATSANPTDTAMDGVHAVTNTAVLDETVRAGDMDTVTAAVERAMQKQQARRERQFKKRLAQEQQQIRDAAILREIEDQIVQEILANVDEDILLRIAYSGDDEKEKHGTGTRATSHSVDPSRPNRPISAGARRRALEGTRLSREDAVNNLPEQAFKMGLYRHDDAYIYRQPDEPGKDMKAGKTSPRAAATLLKTSPRNPSGNMPQFVPTPPTSSMPSRLASSNKNRQSSSASVSGKDTASVTSTTSAPAVRSNTDKRDDMAKRTATVTFNDVVTAAPQESKVMAKSQRPRSRSKDMDSGKKSTASTTAITLSTRAKGDAVSSSLVVAPTPTSPLDLWLRELKLDDYVEVLHEEGFRLIDDFEGLSKEDCDRYFGSMMRTGDLLRLVKAISKISPEVTQRYELLARDGMTKEREEEGN
jgi:hypothetical protein